MHQTQWIELPGVVNMRDLGGMPTDDGRAVQPHRLLRSDNLQDLPPESVRRVVDEFGVSDIIDLRTGIEVTSEGQALIHQEPGVQWHHHSFYPDDTLEHGIPDPDDDDVEVDLTELPWLTDGTHEGEAEEHADRLEAHYLQYYRRRPDSIVEGLRDIAHAKGAALVHCAAGKDRTGNLIALALTVCGVPRDEIIADYAATNERVALIFERLANSPTYADDMAGQQVDDQTTPAETLRGVFNALDKRYGGPLAWLASEGWTEQDSDALRHKLLDA